MADQVAIEDIKNKPMLFEKYKNHKILKRPNLPPQKLFVDYIRGVTTVNDLYDKTNIKKKIDIQIIICINAQPTLYTTSSYIGIVDT